MTLKTSLVRLPSVASICVSFGSKLQIYSAGHELWNLQDLHGRRCVTLTFNLMTLKT